MTAAFDNWVQNGGTDVAGGEYLGALDALQTPYCCMIDLSQSTSPLVPKPCLPRQSSWIGIIYNKCRKHKSDDNLMIAKFTLQRQNLIVAAFGDLREDLQVQRWIFKWKRNTDSVTFSPIQFFPSHVCPENNQSWFCELWLKWFDETEEDSPTALSSLGNGDQNQSITTSCSCCHFSRFSSNSAVRVQI